ncbi:MAG TPA: hypothetical protein VIL74_17065 [Pyrinomonadaceae bacterium]
MHYWLLMIALAGFVLSISAQENSPVRTPDEPGAALENQAAALIDEILLEIPQLESKENQIAAATLAIDLIWQRDEQRARALARETAAKIRSELVPILEKDELLRAYLLYPPHQYQKLRTDFLLKIVKYDPAFAQKLAAATAPLVLKAVPKTPNEQTTIFNWQKEERDLEQRLAFRLADKDVEQALAVARESLRKDSSQESLNVLRRLQFKDAKIADAFADEIIRGLLTEDFTKDRGAHETTAVFFRQLDPQTGGFGGMLVCKDCSLPAALNLNPQRLRQLAAKWLNYALTLDDEKAGFYILPAAGLLEKLVPGKKAAIRVKIAAIEKNAPKRFEYEQFERKVSDREVPPEELAKLALTKKGVDRFHAYRQAFVKAANASRAALERLSASIADHPENEEKRWLVDEINVNLAGKTAEEGELDQAYEMSQKIAKRDRRLGLLAFLALEFQKKGETEKTKRLTEEIAALLDLSTKDKMPKAIVGYDIFSTVFQTFAKTDTTRAFELVETVLPAANDSYFGGFPNLHELKKRHASQLLSYAETVRRLAETDFERTRRLTLYFKRPELALFAKLLIAQAILDEKYEWGNVADFKQMVVITN